MNGAAKIGRHPMFIFGVDNPRNNACYQRRPVLISSSALSLKMEMVLVVEWKITR